MEATERYPRLCDVKKTGMFTGYVFYDGLFECEDEECALAYAMAEGFDSLQEAYDADIYYYTEWDECDDTWYECHEGVWYECTDDSKVKVSKLNFKKS